MIGLVLPLLAWSGYKPPVRQNPDPLRPSAVQALQKFGVIVLNPLGVDGVAVDGEPSNDTILDIERSTLSERGIPFVVGSANAPKNKAWITMTTGFTLVSEGGMTAYNFDGELNVSGLLEAYFPGDPAPKSTDLFGDIPIRAQIPCTGVVYINSSVAIAGDTRVGAGMREMIRAFSEHIAAMWLEAHPPKGRVALR